MTLRDSREMNYDSKLQNMSWFCYNMWTRCPRQAWPHSSLIIKHYWVQVGSHHQWYRSPCISLALKKRLILLEQINQWLGVLGIRIEWGWLVYQTIEYFAHAWLTWDDSRGSNMNFLKFTAATCIKCTWTRGSHFLHPSICFMSWYEKML